MQFLVYGSQEFALTVTELIRHCGHEVAGMVDDYQVGPGVLGRFADIRHTHPPCDFAVALAIGYQSLPARWGAWQEICRAGYRTPPLIHPRAYVADSAQIGPGTMIMAAATVDVRARVEEACVVWPQACINHDSLIGANTFISPSVTICGSVEIGRHSFIGAGSVIVDHCQVPAQSRIKMLTRYTGAPS